MQRQDFDAGYVHRLASGDAEVEKHFSEYFGELLSIKLRPRLRYSDAVDDVKQETFLRVLAIVRKQGLERPEALGSLVNSVCNNVLFEVYRSEAKVADAPEDRASEDASAETALVSTEEREHVRKVLAEMPPKDQAILRCIFYEEGGKAEICREFGIDREYLRVLLHRAKTRFKQLFLQSDVKSGALHETIAARAARNRG